MLAGGVAFLAYRTLQTRAHDAESVTQTTTTTALSLELPPVAEGTLLADVDVVPEGVPPTPAGGSTVPRIDTGNVGRGGTGHVASPAIHLDDRDEEIRLSPDLTSRLDRDQQQRLHTATDRAAWEDRRATTHPMELVFLASGTGERAERRPIASTDPSRGARSARRAAQLGGAPGAAEQVAGDEPALPQDIGSDRTGVRDVSPGVGVADARAGVDHRASADVTRGRPSVTLASPSIPASQKGRERDDMDTDQEVATTVQALVHASTAGGAPGEGNGGVGGGGDPGAGGDRLALGSHPVPLGTGEGDWFDLNTTDPRLFAYFRKIHAKVDPLWADAFPRSAILDLKQGTVIFDVTIAQDGSTRISWPPLRPSGIDEFDRNVYAALKKASPFDPIPKELGRTSLRIRAPFVAENPIVK